MNSKQYSTIQIRRGSNAAFNSANPILASGEPAYAIDSQILKIGDGVTSWSNLIPITSGNITGYAPLNSPNFTGTPTAPTANSGTNTTQIATTAFVRTEVANLIDSAPALLDTLNELAAAINDDENFAVTINNAIATVSGIAQYGYNYSIDTQEPDGFINRSDSTISFTNLSRQFTIAPTGTSYSIYNNGTKVTKSSAENLVLPTGTALYFIHFDKSTNNLSYKTTGFDFSTDIPIAQVYWNNDDGKMVYFGEERHGITMDSATHKYLHNVFGTQYINGLSISNYTLSGDGSSDSDASIAIGDGVIYDEDIVVNITNDASPSNPFEQILYPTGQIPVYYKNGSNGAWTNTTANNFPVKVGTTAQYNLLNGGVWSASDTDNPSNDRYVASWICATSQEHAPVISIMGQRVDSSFNQAQSNNAWSNLNLTGLPIVELRPLYRLIYDTKSSFTNNAKAFLVDVLDIRGHVDTVTGTTQNDHGSLYGLADDDHLQYVHIDDPRTIDATHTFSNGLLSNGNIVISGALDVVGSGNFSNSLYVNNIPVSVSGHTHSSSDITNFNSSVSGIIDSALSTDIIGGTGISVTYDSLNNDLIIASNGLVPVINSGVVTGSISINAGINNSIQTLGVSGAAVTFTKGIGWPTASGLSTDVVLKINSTASTAITWSIVNEWYNQPAAGALSSGVHLFLLRGVNTIIEGHYIGSKT